MPPIIEMCDAHIHVGRYYRMTNAEVFDRRDFYYEPKIVAEVLKRCDMDEFIYSSISCQRHVTIAEVEREARETQAAFGPGAHPFYWVTGPFYDDDPDIKILDKGLFESVKIHGLETPWVKDRSKDLDRILSVLEERDVPVQFHSGDMFKPAEHFCKVAAINHEVVDEKQRQMIEAAKRGLV